MRKPKRLAIVDFAITKRTNLFIETETRLVGLEPFDLVTTRVHIGVDQSHRTHVWLNNSRTNQSSYVGVVARIDIQGSIEDIRVTGYRAGMRYLFTDYIPAIHSRMPVHNAKRR